MHPTPYPDLNHALAELVNRLQDILAEDFIGAYLQGSFAVGDFDEHSDCDFVVVIEKELLPAQVDALQIMHPQVYSLGSEWAKHLEGSYFPKDVLRDHSKKEAPLWYLDHGAQHLIYDPHCNTSLVRWIVREQGVTLAGPPPMTLVDPITADQLREEIYETIHHWGQHILEHPDDYSNRFYQAYLILNYCRMLHDLICGYPGSKLAGAEWAKANLDPGWIPYIDDTWNGRPDPASQVRQPADPQNFEKTLEFIRYIMEESKQHFSLM